MPEAFFHAQGVLRSFSMHFYFHIFGLHIPAYGVMVVIGGALANVLAYFTIKKKGGDFNDVMALEGYAFLFGLIGAKGLYLFASRNEIEWDRLTDINYFIYLFRGGFVFYGGLIAAVIGIFLAGKWHKLDTAMYVRKLIYLVPLAHGFGRIGCFLGGCCYGIPYDGPFSVVFPEGTVAPAGIPLFPVQLLEAVVLFVIFGILAYLSLKKEWPYMLETYLILYGIARFGIEFLRYDDYRGSFLALSTSQWVSLGAVAVAVIMILFRKKRPTLLRSKQA